MNYDECKKRLEAVGGLICGHNEILQSDPYMLEVSAGWYKLICHLVDELVAAGWDRKINQIKTKFGGLRFYTPEILPENMEDMIRKAESLSYKTCEFCGDPSAEYDMGNRYEWIYTLCSPCRELKTNA